MEKFLFYFFSIVTCYGALRVITIRNPVHAVLHLVLTFVSSAGIWMLARAEFLAIALILVYVGAVMVLFLFVVMMLDINVAPLREGFIKFLPVGSLIALTLLFQLGYVLGWSSFGDDVITDFTLTTGASAARGSNTQALGYAIYTEYLYPFEIAGAILLIAIVAAISLTLRKREGVKKQAPEKQVRVRRQDRVRLVKMKADTDD